MALRITTVADSISKLTVTGLTILDLNEIKPATDTRGSWMVPLPPYIEDMEIQIDSTGAAAALMTVWYTLPYRVFYKRAGTGRSNKLENVSGKVALLGLIVDAILAIVTITGCEDMKPLNPTNMDAALEDPAGNLWEGFDIGFRVMEFVN